MTNRVWVVTRSDLGWDCVIAIYDYNKVSEDTLHRRYPSSEYHYIDDRHIEDMVYLDE